jgi:aminoglycoside phosphotransferase family enzyme
VAFLRRREAYPARPRRVDAVETHMSWVFLTTGFAYKLKKPICHERLDFSTLDRRRYYCTEEVRLNRRLAEDVYLRAIALTLDADGGLSVGGRGAPVDWLVQMRRLPADHMLDAVVVRGPVAEGDVHAIACRLAHFYARAPSLAVSGLALRTRLERGLHADFRELVRPEFGLAPSRVEKVVQQQLAFLEEHARLFDSRVREGRIVDGHGDLRPEHICLAPNPVIIDCLEFCAELRELDPIDELAFLTLECERLGQPRVGRWFLEAYTQATGDALPEVLFGFYHDYRALRRAKLAAWHLDDPTVRDPGHFRTKAQRYLELVGRRSL